MKQFKLIGLTLFGLTLMVNFHAAHAAFTVSVEGIESVAKKYRVPEKGRLSDVINVLPIGDNVCLNATAMLRLSEQARQRQWKLALLYDLEVLVQSARLTGDDEQVAWFKELAAQIERQPVTGRLLGQYFNPHGLEARPADNILLHSGDRLHFLACGNSVTVFDGGLQKVTYRAGRTLKSYAEDIARHDWQDPGYLWVVYADGEFKKTKVGYWQHKREYSGSRAWLFRPIKAGLLRTVSPNFNFELARWLATQVVEGNE